MHIINVNASEEGNHPRVKDDGKEIAAAVVFFMFFSFLTTRVYCCAANDYHYSGEKPFKALHQVIV